MGIPTDSIRSDFALERRPVFKRLEQTILGPVLVIPYQGERSRTYVRVAAAVGIFA
ncbi:MAG: hypothetical protein WCE79_10365 [Xanthobacteraceae bacterium]